MKNRVICILLVLVFALALIGPAGAAKTGVSVTIDKKPVSFSASDGAPFIDENSRTLVPLRVVMETYGCIVQWDQNTKTAYVVKDGVTVTVTIGQKYIRVNGMSQAIDTAAVIKDSRTYLPIRAVLEAFGAEVEWDAASRTVVVTHPATEKSEPINGKDGVDGKDGINGKDGADGVSVTNVKVDGNGDLLVTLSNGQTINAGHVQGKDGVNGKDGADGRDGINGKDGANGQNGADGVSVTNVKMDENGYIIVSLSNGTTVNTGKAGYVVNPTITTDKNNYLASPGDATDMTASVQAMLDQTGCCNLGPGDFYVTGIDIPDNATLRGSGTATRIILADSVSAGYAVRLKSYSCVKDLQILGQTAQYTPKESVGVRNGIVFEGTANSQSPELFYRSTIENVSIANFGGSGIKCYNTGGNVAENLHVSDVFIYWCDAGINVSFYSEYHRWTNVSVNGCWFGCICNGGNNNFDNCDFSGNQVGLLIDNRSGQSTNAAHGTFSACSFNHAGGNTGTAIRILGANHGEVFTGAQIFFGAIEIENSRGIRFVGANMGRQVPISVKNSSAVVFSDCTMYSPEANPVTASGNNALSFTDCYCLDGTAFTPLSESTN